MRWRKRYNEIEGELDRKFGRNIDCEWEKQKTKQRERERDFWK